MPYEPIRHEVTVKLSGKVELHFYVHVDHAALAEKLGKVTDQLSDAVDAASQESPPVPLS